MAVAARGDPVLRETVDLAVPESSTIVEYLDALAGRSGQLLPDDRALVPQARLWDRVVDDYVARPMQTVVGDRLRPGDRRDDLGVERARETLGDLLDGQVAGLLGSPARSSRSRTA